jgi:hypothetical protein
VKINLNIGNAVKKVNGWYSNVAWPIMKMKRNGGGVSEIEAWPSWRKASMAMAWLNINESNAENRK